MNKLGNLPLKILEKVPLNKARWTSNPVKVFVGVAGTLLALSALGVICLFSFKTHRPKTADSNALIDAPIFPATNMTTPAEMTKAAGKGDGSVTAFPGTNQAGNGTVAAEHSAVDQTPTPALSPIPSPAPVAQVESKSLTSDSEFLRREPPEFGLPGENSLDHTGSKTVERQLPKSVRKHLEKERREAERKRSRLEDLYQKHLISSEAYKKGEQEYKSEIKKYRSEVNAAGSLPNSLD
jgi:hypothetical protein